MTLVTSTRLTFRRSECDSPFDAHDDEREHRTEQTDVLHVVDELAEKLAEVPRERHPLGELQPTASTYTCTCTCRTCMSETHVFCVSMITSVCW